MKKTGKNSGPGYDEGQVKTQIASRLRRFRENAHERTGGNPVSRESAAKTAGVGPATYARMENGTTFPNLRTLLKLCNALRIRLKELIS